MKSKLFIVLLIFAIVGLVYYSYPIVRDRYFSIQEDSPEPAKENAVAPREGSVENIIPEEADDQAEEQQTLKEEGKILKEITRDDCASECESFAGAELEYCQEVCGLKIIEKPSGGCENLSGLKKDYCFKDLGISEKDPNICAKISDKNIREACENRILEDMVDENMGREDLPE